MSRRLSREIAIQTLFFLDFNPTFGVHDALEAVFLEREKISNSVKEYSKFLVDGTKENLTEIDAFLTKLSKQWKLNRMPSVDRNIARLALFEMKYSKEPLNAGIVINEAVELAKVFGTEDSSRFINGILGSAVRSDEMVDHE